MNRYRKKPEFVTAVRFTESMARGEERQPEGVAFCRLRRIGRLVEVGEYVVTDEHGTQFVLSECTFEKSYEPAGEQCPECNGEGSIQELQGIVSRDMAIDACEPSLEGMPIFEKERCRACGGDGFIPDPRDPENAPPAAPATTAHIDVTDLPF